MLVNQSAAGDPASGDDDLTEAVDPVPSWLEEAPEQTPALMVARPQVLPFEQLSAEDFERLVLGLVRRQGDVVHAQLYGVRGQDQHGIDLYCRLRSPGATGRRYRTVQCRNVAETTATDLAAAVEDFLEGSWARRTDTFVFATRVAAVRSERAEAVEAAASRLGEVGISFDVWDGESLSSMFYSLPELVDRFFGREATRQFCGEEAARRLAGRDHARSMLDGLETRLRERTRGVLTASVGGAANARQLTLDRAEVRQRLMGAVRDAARTSGVVAVHGEPDVGKSALALDVVASLRDDGVGIVPLSLRDVPLGPLSSFEQLLGGPVAQVLGDLATEGVRLIVLDGAEIVLEGGSDLLGDLASAAVRAGIGVVAVARNDARQAVVDALGPAAAHGWHPGRASSAPGQITSEKSSVLVSIDVPALSPDEVARVRAVFSEMERLADDQRAAWLVGRVGLVDLLLRADAVAALPDGALSEADVFTAVWSHWVRRGERVDRSGATPDGRDAALTGLARQRLCMATTTDAAAQMALPSLRSDGLLLPVDERFAWSAGDDFSSDVVRDLATARLLLTDPAAILRDAHAPRWVMRAARIASQVALVGAWRRAPNDAAATRVVFRRLQAAFDQLAARHGDRWADVPLDAALTAGPADAILDACSADLLADSARLLDRALRLLSQRHSAIDAVEPVIGAPVVAFVLSHLDQIDTSTREVTERARNLITSWLRGIARLEREGKAGQFPTGYRLLRQQIRDYLLQIADHVEEAYLEGLALLGGDIDEPVRAFLRDVAAQRPAFLAPCVERFDAMTTLARVDLDLLIELTLAYYIERPDGRPWGLSPFDDGIRRHRTGLGPAIPQAAWYYGPFWELLRAAPHRALPVINQMLDHAAVNRSRQLAGMHNQATPSIDELPGATFDVANLGARHYVGDEHVWAWYRGSTVGPYPCMSALLAVERYVDQVISHGAPIARLAQILMNGAHSLAMAGLVVGVLVRHLDEITTELDEWLMCPAVWQLEFSRRTHEGILHIQGRDGEEIHGRDRRTWTPIDIAAFLTFSAWSTDNHARLDELRAIGGRLVDAARAVTGTKRGSQLDVESASTPDNAAGGEDDRDGIRAAEDAAAERAILTVRRWSSMLDADQYTLTRVPEGAAWEWHPPADINEAMADTQRDLDRSNEAYRLLNTYGVRFVPPAEERPASIPPVEQLAADLTIARSLADDPPAGGPSDAFQVPAAVAAVAITAACDDVLAFTRDDLEWAGAIVVSAALQPPFGPWSFDGSMFGSGPDRAAAGAVPRLLLPAFTDERLEGDQVPLIDEDDLVVVANGLTALTTSLYTEVRRITAPALNLIWSAPCGPESSGSATCRHVIAWSAVEAGARHVGLTPWTLTGRREYQELPGPLLEALRDTPARDFMLTRLGPAVIAACDAARSGCCVADQAIALRNALLDAYARTAVHWAAEDYECRPEDRCAVAVALLAMAAHDLTPLVAVVAGLTGQARALHDTLHAMAMAATYDEDARASLRSVWSLVMDAVLDAVDAGSTIFAERSWGDYALASVIPSPQASIADSDPVGSMAAARFGWPTPEDLRERIERWLPHAAGQRHTADDLIGLLQTVPLAIQAHLGLPWLRSVILTKGRWSDRGTWRAVDWLRSLRDANVLDELTRPMYNELVDALAADGYGSAVALQHEDE